MQMQQSTQTKEQGDSNHYLLAPIPKTSLLQKIMYAAIGGIALGIVIGLSFVLSK